MNIAKEFFENNESRVERKKGRKRDSLENFGGTF
jgi:hypothetical protein